MTSLAVFYLYGRWEQDRLLASRTYTAPVYQPVQPVQSVQPAQPVQPITTEIFEKEVNPVPAVYQTKLTEGSLLGKLNIPEIGLQAAILEGTTFPILAKAPGHLITSVFPGEVGTSIIAAHNVTTFSRISELKFGAEFTISTEAGELRFRVVSSEIVKVGAGILDTRYPSVILETCYPFDAVYLTNQRYLVNAVLIEKV